MRAFAYIGLVALVSGAAFGQPGDTAPKFEIADVHPSTAPGIGNQSMKGGLYRGGRFELRTASMVDLIRTAYGVDPDKVTGGPGWLEKDRFDVIAKAPVNSTQETLHAMLQTLLAERFALVVHNDTKPLASYALTVGKKVQMKQGDGSGDRGCRLQLQSDAPQAGAGGAIYSFTLNGTRLRIPAGSLLVYSCRNVTMAALAQELGRMVYVPVYLDGKRVVDGTELKGAWNSTSNTP